MSFFYRTLHRCRTQSFKATVETREHTHHATATCSRIGWDGILPSGLDAPVQSRGEIGAAVDRI